MYGLLIENLASFIRVQWGEGKWDSVRKHAGVDAPSFSIHHVYAETLLARLARSATQILGVDERQFFEAMGVYFVEFVGHYGYDSMLSVLGRHLRDFLNGLDNLHEYLKFSYTKMRAPSFYCDSETANGLRLHYRSKRRGFVWYTMGQIKQVAKHFYEQEIQIELVSEELDGETMHNIFQLTFDNQAYVEHENLRSVIKKESQLPIRASIIFEVFPFCIVFSTEMIITYTGHALLTILRDLIGQTMTEAFEIIRPLIAFSFNTILERSNNIFELVTTSPIKEESLDKIMEDEEAEGVHLKLRGQMMHMEEWNMILFLANPVMPDLPSLVSAGIYINDLSLHDCSRDLVLAGTQQSVELKLALDQEQHKSKKLEESMKKLDEEMKRTDELLYQMIPKQVADRLRKGETSVQTCEVFESVSILFSDVVTFTDICSKISPMQVVSMLNHMYSLFDQLTERNGVYKVETIGDSYMVVSGAPVKETNHAERVADMAMDMVDAMQAIKDPTREGEHLKIRVGCHSGMVVAGVVGVKMPRYCLFGDTVNTASRMESTSEAAKIQISEVCKAKLPASYKTELRGTVPVKGKGEMNTYWLIGRDSRVPLSKIQAGSFDWTEPGMQVKQERRYSKSSDKGGSRKSSVIATTEDATAQKSRAATPTPTPAPVVTPARQAPPLKTLPPKITLPPPPKIVETPAPPDSPKPPVGSRQGSLEDNKGNQMDLNVAGADVYRSARRLSEAIQRSRSPSPAGPREPAPPPTQQKPAPKPSPSSSTPKPKQQGSMEDSKGNKMDLNVAGKDLYAGARRLSDALRNSRSPSPTGKQAAQPSTKPVVRAPAPTPKLPPKLPIKQQFSVEDSKGNKMTLNPVGKEVYASARRISDALAAARSRSPSPTGGASGANRNSRARQTTEKSKPAVAASTQKITLVRQTTLAELPDKLAGIMPQQQAQTVNIVKVSGENAPAGVGKGQDVICIVPSVDDNVNDADTEEGNDRESYLINVKMRKGQENGNGLKRTINGIAVGISRLPKNEALKKKIRESKIAVVTADVLTDIGCGPFAEKQKQVISQACSIL